MRRINAGFAVIGSVLIAVLVNTSSGVCADLPPELQQLVDTKQLRFVEKLTKLDGMRRNENSVVEIGTELLGCIQKGGQVVLYPSGAFCTSRYNGEAFFRDAAPNDFDPKDACKSKRILPAGVIRWLGNKLASILKPSQSASPSTADTRDSDDTPHAKELQIRIIGAAFCDNELNLSDLNIPYALVLDRSVFTYGIRAEKLTVGGNLSFGGAYIYDNLAIGNSTINGTLYGRGAFIQRIRIYDTQVLDNLRFNRAVLPDYTNFERVNARAIDLSDSRLSTLNAREITISERVNLSNAQATCKFRIEKSDITELRGFDLSVGVMSDPKKPASELTLGLWNSLPPDPPALNVKHAIFKVDEVKNRLGNLLPNARDKCTETNASFAVVEGNYRSICIQRPNWGYSLPNNGMGARMSFIRATVASDMTLNLFGPPASSEKLPMPETPRVLELLGLKIGTLFFDFHDNGRQYRTRVDQLDIGRVHDAADECTDFPSEARRETPDSTRVKVWLEKNITSSQQPYLAFIKAYENAGADATSLRIAKAQFAFDKDRLHLWHVWRDTVRNADAGQIISYLLSFQWLTDFIRITLSYIAGYVADFGYHPYKSFIYIGISICVSYLLIKRWLGVTHLQSELRSEPMPINPYFLLDLMIPVYNIDPAFKEISGYFFANGEKIDQATARRLNKIFIVLRILGIVVAVFLTASLKALVLD